MSDWNAQVIAEFRANGGKVAQFGDAPLVILNTMLKNNTHWDPKIACET